MSRLQQSVEGNGYKIPVWLILFLLFSLCGFLVFSYATGRQLQWSPFGLTPPPTPTPLPPTPDPKPALSCKNCSPLFSDGRWRYFTAADGFAVAKKLTEIGPPENAVSVAYDGSANNAFHVWYRGEGAGTKFEYSYLPYTDLKDFPSVNYFNREPGVIPAGIGGSSGTAIPIFFRVTR